jgi:hypothetical protein
MNLSTFLLIILICATLQPCVQAQSSPSYGLGPSDGDWKRNLGKPSGSGRDVWVYHNGRLHTRSWARKEAPRGRNWNGYVEENYIGLLVVAYGKLRLTWVNHTKHRSKLANVRETQHASNKSLDASGGSVLRRIIGPAMLE